MLQLLEYNKTHTACQKPTFRGKISSDVILTARELPNESRPIVIK